MSENDIEIVEPGNIGKITQKSEVSGQCHARGKQAP
jgi:hypothetical protein